MSHTDILDAPSTRPKSTEIRFTLVYIEFGILLIAIVLGLLGSSVLVVPFIGMGIVIYGIIAAFIKPQFEKGKGLKIALGIWNAVQLITFSIGLFFKIQSWPYASELVSLSTLAIALYYLILPFVESTTLKSMRFATLMFFGLGGAIFFVGALFKIQSWPFASQLLTISPIVLCIALGLMIVQLVQDVKKHPYYWFYFPRIVPVLISFFLS